MITKAAAETYRQLLTVLLSRLEGDRSQLKHEALEPSGGDANGGLSAAPIHRDDLASHLTEEETTLSLVGNEEKMISEINAALERIDNGSFGRCEACGKEISKQRLHALPYVRHCFACAKGIQRQPSP